MWKRWAEKYERDMRGAEKFGSKLQIDMRAKVIKEVQKWNICHSRRAAS